MKFRKRIGTLISGVVVVASMRAIFAGDFSGGLPSGGFTPDQEDVKIPSYVFEAVWVWKAVVEQDSIRAGTTGTESPKLVDEPKRNATKSLRETSALAREQQQIADENLNRVQDLVGMSDDIRIERQDEEYLIPLQQDQK